MNFLGTEESLRTSKLRRLRRKRKRTESKVEQVQVNSKQEEKDLKSVKDDQQPVETYRRSSSFKSLIPVPNFTPLDHASETEEDEVQVLYSEGSKQMQIDIRAEHSKMEKDSTFTDIDTHLDDCEEKAHDNTAIATVNDNRDYQMGLGEKTELSSESNAAPWNVHHTRTKNGGDTNLLGSANDSNKNNNNNNTQTNRAPCLASNSIHSTTAIQVDRHNKSSSSDFKRESQRKRFVKQEKQLELEHDDLMHTSKHSSLSFKHHPTTNTSKNNANNHNNESYTPCTLCSTCPCTRRGSALVSLEQNARNETKSKQHFVLARNDADIEMALIARLARLEKSASWFDSLCTKVSRELKRHRKRMMNEKAQKLEQNKDPLNQRHTFLQDVTVDVHEIGNVPVLPKRMVARAIQKTFSFRKKHQPTLTQMMNDDDQSQSSSSGDSGDDENDVGDDPDSDDTSHLRSSESEKDDNNNGLEKCHADNHDATDMTHVPVEDDFQTQLSPNKNHTAQVNLRMASYRGKAKNLWAASKLSDQDLQLYLRHDVEIPDLQHLLQIDHYDYIEDGLEELLGVFQNNYIVDNTVTDEKGHGFWKDTQQATFTSTEKQEVTISQLSPMAKSIHHVLVNEVEADHGKLSVLNELCPSWKENQRFALCQSEDELQVALENVHVKQRRILEAIGLLNKQRVALQVFEHTIKIAIDRHHSNDAQLNPFQKDLHK